MEMRQYVLVQAYAHDSYDVYGPFHTRAAAMRFQANHAGKIVALTNNTEVAHAHMKEGK